MATIRVKRSTGSTAPTGLTFGEPAFVNGLNSFYVTNNSGTSVRVGAEVDTSTALGTSDNKIPTQNAVKTYVDGFVAGGAVSTLNGLTGAVFIGAGTAISIAAAGKGITLTNTGVQSIAGTSNQITASGSTGAVTLSLPSALTVPGSLSVTTDLTVTGNLTVNGTTTTVNSDTMTIDDPLIILGTSGGVPISVSDGGKDRGIAFNYFNVSGKTGFFGWDASATQFIFAGDASITSDVATVNSFSPIQASSVKLYSATNGANAILTPTTLAGADRTYTLPDHTGTVVVPSDLGTSNYILKANGTTSQPTWVAQSTLAVGSASTLTTARSIGITGDIDGTATSFNGSADITISAQIAAGSILNADINASAGIVDTKLATISTANKVSLSALDIDGGTVTTTIVGSDLLIVDDGANGTNRYVTVDNLFGTNSTATVDGGSF